MSRALGTDATDPVFANLAHRALADFWLALAPER